MSSSFLMQQVASTRLKRRRVEEDNSDEEREETQKKAKKALFGTSRAAAKGKASAAVQLAQRQEAKEEEENEKEKEQANTKPKAKEMVCNNSLRDSALKWVSLHSLRVSSSFPVLAYWCEHSEAHCGQGKGCIQQAGKPCSFSCSSSSGGLRLVDSRICLGHRVMSPLCGIVCMSG